MSSRSNRKDKQKTADTDETEVVDLDAMTDEPNADQDEMDPIAERKKKMTELGYAMGDLAGNLESSIDLDAIAAEPAPEGEGSRRDADTNVVADHLEELAEDMLTVRDQLARLEENQKRIAASLEQLSESVASSATSTGRELDRVRRELIGAQQHMAHMNVFNAIVPTVERMRDMRSGLDAESDSRLVNQLTAITESLNGVLRSLGCTEFQAEPGQAFEPSWMECLRKIETGTAGTVQECVRPGYVAGQTLVRAAGVIVSSAPSVDENSTDGESPDE